MIEEYKIELRASLIIEKNYSRTGKSAKKSQELKIVIKNGYRALIVNSHLIFYRKSQNNQVEIIRILHQKMDIETRIND